MCLTNVIDAHSPWLLLDMCGSFVGVNQQVFASIYIYIYIYWRLGVCVQPGNRFRFRVRVVRDVRVVRAGGRGEAAWACMRRFPPVARAKVGKMYRVVWSRRVHRVAAVVPRLSRRFPPVARAKLRNMYRVVSSCPPGARGCPAVVPQEFLLPRSTFRLFGFRREAILGTQRHLEIMTEIRAMSKQKNTHTHRS